MMQIKQQSHPEIIACSDHRKQVLQLERLPVRQGLHPSSVLRFGLLHHSLVQVRKRQTGLQSHPVKADGLDRLLPELPELCQQPVLPSLVQGRKRQIKRQSHLHLIVCLDHPRVLCL